MTLIRFFSIEKMFHSVLIVTDRVNYLKLVEMFKYYFTEYLFRKKCKFYRKMQHLQKKVKIFYRKKIFVKKYLCGQCAFVLFCKKLEIIIRKFWFTLGLRNDIYINFRWLYDRLAVAEVDFVHLNPVACDFIIFICIIVMNVSLIIILFENSKTLQAI